MTDPETLLTPQEVADTLKMSMSTVKRWAKAGKGPQPFHVGARLVRYRPSDVAAYINGGGDSGKGE